MASIFSYIFSATLWVWIVALIHVGIMIGEMLFWRNIAPRVLNLSEDAIAETAKLGQNMGLYNGFLGVGLFFALYGNLSPEQGFAMQVYLCACVLVAGVVGALTLRRTSIFVLQSIPATVALCLLVYG